MDFLALIILIIGFGIQLLTKTRSDENRSGFFGFWLFIVAVILIFDFAIYQSYEQYISWKSNELTKLFLPPYQNWNYFILYIRTRFFNPYLLSLFFAVIFLYLAKKYNKKYQEKFMEKIEPYLLGISIFTIGQPGWLFYVILLLLTALIFQAIKVISYKLLVISSEGRLSLYYFWLPIAISTIISSRWLEQLHLWQFLKF